MIVSPSPAIEYRTSDTGIASLPASVEPAQPHRSWPLALEIGLLGSILALAAVLRFYALPQRGLIVWDEGKFALEGVRMEALLQAAMGQHASLVVGKAIGTAKPTHALLIGLGYLLFGVHDYVPAFVDATASVGQVILIYLIARRLFGAGVALAGALLLAVSQYEIIYARSALSESDGCFFLLAGVLLWLHSCQSTLWSDSPTPGARRHLFAGAVLMGVAFTVGYRLVVYIGAIFALDLLWSWRVSGLRPVGRRTVPWALGLALAPALWQSADLVTRANGLVLFRGESGGVPQWYWREVVYQIHDGKQAVIHVQPFRYLQWYVLFQGWLAVLLLLAGLCLAIGHLRRGRRAFPWLAVGVPIAVAYLVYSFASFIVPRNLEAAIPFTCVLIAAAFVTMCTRIPRGGAIFAVIGLLVLGGAGAAMSWRLSAERSGYARAARYVERLGYARALRTNEVLVFYFRGDGSECMAPPVPPNPRGLRSAVASGYTYAIVDFHLPDPLRSYIQRHALHVARYRAAGSVSLGEDPVLFENGDIPGSQVMYVDVYRLNVLRNLPRTSDHVSCNRDSLGPARSPKSMVPVWPAIPPIGPSWTWLGVVCKMSASRQHRMEFV